MLISTTMEARELLRAMSAANETAVLTSFVVSATPGAVPDELDTNIPVGAVVYTGSPAQMRFGRISEDEFVIYCILDTPLGLFGVGNIVIYMESGASGPVPFIWCAIDLGLATTKWTNGAPVQVGNRIVIQVAVRYPNLNELIPNLNIELMYARLRYTKNEVTIGPAEMLPWNVMVMEEHTTYDATTLVVKDNKNQLLWGAVPSYFIDDPFFGQIHGGVTGEDYGSPSNLDYLDGRNYRETDLSYDTIDGGAAWAVAPETAQETGTDGDRYIPLPGG